MYRILFILFPLFSLAQTNADLWLEYKIHYLGSQLGKEELVLLIENDTLIANYWIVGHKSKFKEQLENDRIRYDSIYRKEKLIVKLKPSSTDSIKQLISPGSEKIVETDLCSKSGALYEIIIHSNGIEKVYSLYNTFDSIPFKIIRILLPYLPSHAVNGWIPYQFWESALECYDHSLINSLRGKHSPEEWIISMILKKERNVYELNDTLGLFVNYEKYRGYRFFFYEMDTSKIGVNKYLKEADLPTLNKYQPKLNVFYGKKSSHIHNMGPWMFFVFEYDARSGYVGDTTENRLNKNFYDVLRKIEFQSKEDKENFGLELFQIMIPNARFLFDHEHNVLESKINWNEEILEIENSYSGYQKPEKYILKIEFQGRWIKDLRLKFIEE